jgi:hypothetical protein
LPASRSTTSRARSEISSSGAFRSSLERRCTPDVAARRWSEFFLSRDFLASKRSIACFSMSSPSTSASAGLAKNHTLASRRWGRRNVQVRWPSWVLLVPERILRVARTVGRSEIERGDACSLGPCTFDVKIIR